jgi:uncharacterized protein (TIGR02145 family)
MKSIIRIIVLSLFIFTVIIHSCKKEAVPTLTTSAISNITGTTATSGGAITSEGSGTIIARGVCWSTAITPTIADIKTQDGAGAGTYTSNISGLNGGTVYFVRAYATNSSGTGYGMALSFSTLGQIPTATTNLATNVTITSAVLNGIINANYLSTIVTFDYGTTISYGQTITGDQSPVNSNINTTITANLTGLAVGTPYHFRIKTVNSLGTTYGDDMSFTTLGNKPLVTSIGASNIRSNSAVLNAMVNANNLSTNIIFEYGTTTNYGNVVNSVQSPLNGNSNILISSSIGGLNIGITYHFRVKADNQLGTSYGDDMTFTTPSNVIDYDGNTYPTVVIGNQTWMATNLKTTHYMDGSTISLVTSNNSWSSLTTGAYCTYNNDPTNLNVLGALYNWFAVMDSRNLCPSGWHVPSDAEWSTLTTFLGGQTIAGGKMKEIGTTHWLNPNTGADNFSGFTGLGASVRDNYGVFGILGQYAYWWTTTENSSTLAWRRKLFNDDPTIGVATNNKLDGFSIRCIKN